MFERLKSDRIARPTSQRRSLRGFIGDPRIRAQGLFLALIMLLIAIIWYSAASNLSGSSTRSGFSFLFEAAPFELRETLISYRAGDTYLRAFGVGILNTLKVAVLGIVLSTILGLLVALGQLSPSVVLARLCRGYIEIVRNVPLLLQLVFWHTFLTSSLPTVRNAASPIEGVFLSNRGLFLPVPTFLPNAWPFFLGVTAAIVVGTIMVKVDRRKVAQTGERQRTGLKLTALLIGLPLAAIVVSGTSVDLDMPALQGFNFRGGMELSPEFAAMLLGFTIYHGAFNAEIIRAGILGVPKGQSEAGRALGLHRQQIMRHVVLPQALHIITPPITNSHLNLTKESSLAVAIGYPEIVRVANITLAETNQALECVAIIMIIYLTLSLATSAILNQVNARAALRER